MNPLWIHGKCPHMLGLSHALAALIPGNSLLGSHRNRPVFVPFDRLACLAHSIIWLNLY